MLYNKSNQWLKINVVCYSYLGYKTKSHCLPYLKQNRIKNKQISVWLTAPGLFPVSYIIDMKWGAFVLLPIKGVLTKLTFLRSGYASIFNYNYWWFFCSVGDIVTCQLYPFVVFGIKNKTGLMNCLIINLIHYFL